MLPTRSHYERTLIILYFKTFKTISLTARFLCRRCISSSFFSLLKYADTCFIFESLSDADPEVEGSTNTVISRSPEHMTTDSANDVYIDGGTTQPGAYEGMSAFENVAMESPRQDPFAVSTELESIVECIDAGNTLHQSLHSFPA